jgi:hypothetical protein
MRSPTSETSGRIRILARMQWQALEPNLADTTSTRTHQTSKHQWWICQCVRNIQEEVRSPSHPKDRRSFWYARYLFGNPESPWFARPPRTQSTNLVFNSGFLHEELNTLILKNAERLHFQLILTLLLPAVFFALEPCAIRMSWRLTSSMCIAYVRHQ